MWKKLIIGLISGIVSGFFSAGGGLILVPAFIYFLNMDEKKARATSVSYTHLAQGRTVNFKNTVIIMTSNVGARIITDKTFLGFSNGNDEEKNADKDYENTKKDVMAELKRQFRPEFLNRIDEIIVFHKFCLLYTSRCV